MAVNYDDQRFQNVKAEEQQALTNVNNMYNNMVNQTDNYYNEMSNAAEEYGNKQAEIQQANTDFTIEKIEQQKAQAEKDYLKEQKGAYVDWQKQSNKYGGNAEVLANTGLARTGYAESSEVAMYTAYQNRISQARDTFNRAVLEYDNGIKEARLTNNSKLAEISYNALKTKLELGLEGFQYKNSLLQQQLAAQNQVSDRYYNRWQDVLQQINTENALAEQQRQFNATYSGKYGSGGGSSSGNYAIEKNGSNSGGNALANLFSSAANSTANAVKNSATGTGNNIASKINNFLGLDPNSSYNPGAIAQLEQLTGNKILKDSAPGESTGRQQTLKDKNGNTYLSNEYKDKNGNYYVWDRDKNQYVKYR